MSHSFTKRETARPDPQPESRRRLNLGILAHVDAGKTSLTEAMLHAGGALARRGRVDDGTTQTDTMALERRRGITIRTAVATFAVGGTSVNLIDTPGHPDFIAQVDRSLAVLDGAVLVLSAVEGVQAQTVVLHRALARLRVPVILFVNKIDRAGADPDGVVAAVRRRLTDAAIPIASVSGPGTAGAGARRISWADRAGADGATVALAEHDDDVLAAWTEDRRLAPEMLWDGLRRLTRSGAVHPLLFGSATTGAGVGDLIDVSIDLLAADPPDADAAVAGQVFSVDRDDGERVCLIRLRSGALAVRDRVHLPNRPVETVAALEVFEPGGRVARRRAVAGDIARVHGLRHARIGDVIGTGPDVGAPPAFPVPALETVVVARDPGLQSALRVALLELADVDPLIGVRPGGGGAVRITVYGEMQQQVIAETLAAEYGIEVEYHSTEVRCIERLADHGRAVVRVGDPGQLHPATVGVEVEPMAAGSGVDLVITAPRRSIPLYVYSSVEKFRDAVRGYLERPLGAGPFGWPVTDIRVTLTESGYIPPETSANHVRYTTERVVAEAIRTAGTVVCEPIDRFRVEGPVASTSDLLVLLGRHHAVSEATDARPSIVVVTGTLPAAEVEGVRRALHGATSGEGVFESELDHYAPVRGAAPRRRE